MEAKEGPPGNQIGLQSSDSLEQDILDQENALNGAVGFGPCAESARNYASRQDGPEWHVQIQGSEMKKGANNQYAGVLNPFYLRVLDEHGKTKG